MKAITLIIPSRVDHSLPGSRVVDATCDGKQTVIVSYSAERLSISEGERTEKKGKKKKESDPGGKVPGKHRKVNPETKTMPSWPKGFSWQASR